MINIMYVADDNFAEIAGVSILSLIEQNREEELHFFLVEDGISKENIEKLRRMIHDNQAEVTFMPKPDIRKIVGTEITTSRWGDNVFARLFVSRFSCMQGIDRLLYIDCDTLIVASLKELYETDLEDYLGAACLECMSNLHKKIIGAQKTDNYINSGVLLLNVRRWIEEDVEAQVIAYIKKHRGRVEYPDQGTINATISNRFKVVSPRYNLTALAYDFTYEEMRIYRKPQFGYSREEWEEAIKNPAIVHFTTSFLSVRPWYEGSKHPCAAEWKAVHDRTPWKEMPYRVLQGRRRRDIKEMIYRAFPKKPAVRIAGVLHAYVKPLLYRVSGCLSICGSRVM